MNLNQSPIIEKREWEWGESHAAYFIVQDFSILPMTSVTLDAISKLDLAFYL